MVALLVAGCGKDPSTEASATPETQGRTVPTLASLAKDGPAFLYFAKKDCGSNSRAIPLVQSVYKPYEGKVKMLAVVNTSEEAYSAWSKRYGTTLELLPDEALELVREMGFRESQHLVVVEKGGQAREIPGGFSREALVALNNALAAEAGVPPAQLDLSDAPDGAAFG